MSIPSLDSNTLNKFLKRNIGPAYHNFENKLGSKPRKSFEQDLQTHTSQVDNNKALKSSKYVPELSYNEMNENKYYSKGVKSLNKTFSFINLGSKIDTNMIPLSYNLFNLDVEFKSKSSVNLNGLLNSNLLLEESISMKCTSNNDAQDKDELDKDNLSDSSSDIDINEILGEMESYQEETQTQEEMDKKQNIDYNDQIEKQSLQTNSKSNIVDIELYQLNIKSNESPSTILQNIIAKFTEEKCLSVDNIDLLSVVSTLSGSKYFQKLLPQLNEEILNLIYDELSGSFIRLLSHQYANYFCQQLFFYLKKEYREDILTSVLSKMESLSNNSNGLCSVIFLFENEITRQEKVLIVNNIKNNYEKLIWRKNAARIFECIVGIFDQDLIYFLQTYLIKNFHKFILFREGYFLLRTVIKSVKTQDLQLQIVEKVSENFLTFIKLSNGCLLCQCIIHNFQIPFFKYTKSCSKHLKSSNNEESETANEIINSDMQNFIKNNVALKRLYLEFSKYFSKWSEKYFKSILDCAIKNGGSLFENFFLETVCKDGFESKHSKYNEFQKSNNNSKFSSNCSVNTFNYNPSPSQSVCSTSLSSGLNNINFIDLMSKSNGFFLLNLSVKYFSKNGVKILLSHLKLNFPFLSKTNQTKWEAVLFTDKESKFVKYEPNNSDNALNNFEYLHPNSYNSYYQQQNPKIIDNKKINVINDNYEDSNKKKQTLIDDFLTSKDHQKSKIYNDNVKISNQYQKESNILNENKKILEQNNYNIPKLNSNNIPKLNSGKFQLENTKTKSKTSQIYYKAPNQVLNNDYININNNNLFETNRNQLCNQNIDLKGHNLMKNNIINSQNLIINSPYLVQNQNIFTNINQNPYQSQMMRPLINQSNFNLQPMFSSIPVPMQNLNNSYNNICNFQQIPNYNVYPNLQQQNYQNMRNMSSNVNYPIYVNNQNNYNNVLNQQNSNKMNSMTNLSNISSLSNIQQDYQNNNMTQNKFATTNQICKYNNHDLSNSFNTNSKNQNSFNSNSKN